MLEQAGPFLILALIVCLPGGIGAVVAARKGRNRAAWFVLCGLLPLLIAVLLAMPPVDTRRK